VTDATFTEIAAGLQFPEGPVAMPDGSVVVVEMFGERVTRVGAGGATTVLCEVKGGPNGLAVGPDGALYLCNNGGSHTPVDLGGLLLPGPFDLDRYSGGLIQRIDHDGKVTNVYTNCAGRPLRSPNDLVMDGHGGFYFTDHGIHDVVGTRTADLSALYYARCDGSDIHEVAYPVHSPNGIGLSPDGTILYYAETYTGRVFRRRIAEPGVLEPLTSIIELDPWALLCGLPGMQLLDSLAVDADGWVSVGTMVNGAVTSISPDGSSVVQVPTNDPLTTNLCFGGSDMRTAYVTLSATGRLVSMDWPRRGLRLAHQ
jgi:gluconolactonase